MWGFFTQTDEFLHGSGRFAAEAPAAGRVAPLFIITLVWSALYGAVMGGFGFVRGGDTRLLAFPLMVAAKTPLLLLATFLLCMPFFYVINTLAGLRDDFAEAVRSVLGALACVAVVLAALSPVTLFFYLNTDYYDAAILFNGLMFGVACLASGRTMRRYYGLLIRRSPRHRVMMILWLLLYSFVAIQMAWTLRPFIGDPNPEVPIVFLRSGDLDNAYLEVLRLMRQVWATWGG